MKDQTLVVREHKSSCTTRKLNRGCTRTKQASVEKRQNKMYKIEGKLEFEHLNSRTTTREKLNKKRMLMRSHGLQDRESLCTSIKKNLMFILYVEEKTVDQEHKTR